MKRGRPFGACRKYGKNLVLPYVKKHMQSTFEIQKKIRQDHPTITWTTVQRHLTELAESGEIVAYKPSKFYFWKLTTTE